ncbi:MAG: hypothetical protein ACR2LS_01640 [Thermomicrobiales bacterium]
MAAVARTHASTTGTPGRVVIVGPCASGKSTLVKRLRELGYDAAVCAQEHSDIPTLWSRSSPAVTIALVVDLAILRERRGPNWPEEIWRRQQARLTEAQRSATLVIDTSTKSPGDIVAIATRTLRAHNIRPAIAVRTDDI